MDKLISVIIPVYNAEQYLRTCYECLKNQTYENFEAILIDDGSADRSFEILKQFEKQDKRIKAFTQENSGVSAVRNRGLKLATGEYIVYIDADDRINCDYLERLLADALQYSADVVCCGYQEKVFDADGKEQIIKTVVNQEGFREHAVGCFDDYVGSARYLDVVWAKLFRRETALLEKFAPIRYGEDTRYMLSIMNHKPNIYLSSYVGYDYIRWENSATMTSKISTREYENHKNWVALMEEYIFCNISAPMFEKAKKIYIELAANYMLSMVRNEKKQEFFAFGKDHLCFYEIMSKIDGKNLPLKVRVISSSYKLNPRFSWQLIKLLKRR